MREPWGCPVSRVLNAEITLDAALD